MQITVDTEKITQEEKEALAIILGLNTNSAPENKELDKTLEKANSTIAEQANKIKELTEQNEDFSGKVVDLMDQLEKEASKHTEDVEALRKIIDEVDKKEASEKKSTKKVKKEETTPEPVVEDTPKSEVVQEEPKPVEEVIKEAVEEPEDEEVHVSDIKDTAMLITEWTKKTGRNTNDLKDVNMTTIHEAHEAVAKMKKLSEAYEYFENHFVKEGK